MTAAVDNSKAALDQLGLSLTDSINKYDPSAPRRDARSRFDIVTKCKQIINTVVGPEDKHNQQALMMMELMCTRTCMHLGVFKHLPDEGSISLKQLSEKVNASESLLERLLRILVGVGFVEQNDNDYGYTATGYTRAYQGPSGWVFQLSYDETFTALLHFERYLDSHDRKEPDDMRFCPYTWANNAEGKTLWDVLGSFPERVEVFQKGLAFQDTMTPATGYYDFNKLSTDDPERMVLIDVGGGQGQTIGQILNAHQDLKAEKMMLQDLPGSIEQAKGAPWLPQAVQRMPHDFFTENPVKNARAYYFRHIMHDYSDAVCSQILSQIAKVMGPDSVCLISDTILPKKCYAEADLPAAWLDTFMFVMGGKERTVESFNKICNDAGLEVVHIYRDQSGGPSCLVEAKLMGTSGGETLVNRVEAGSANGVTAESTKPVESEGATASPVVESALPAKAEEGAAADTSTNDRSTEVIPVADTTETSGSSHLNGTAAPAAATSVGAPVTTSETAKSVETPAGAVTGSAQPAEQSSLPDGDVATNDLAADTAQAKSSATLLQEDPKKDEGSERNPPVAEANSTSEPAVASTDTSTITAPSGLDAPSAGDIGAVKSTPVSASASTEPTGKTAQETSLPLPLPLPLPQQPAKTETTGAAESDTTESTTANTADTSPMPPHGGAKLPASDSGTTSTGEAIPSTSATTDDTNDIRTTATSAEADAGSTTGGLSGIKAKIAAFESGDVGNASSVANGTETGSAVAGRKEGE